MNDQPTAPRGRRRWAAAILCISVLVVALLVGYGVRAHGQRRAAALATLQQQEDMVPEVRTAVVASVDKPRQVDLPGSMEAFDSATILARATGYIDKRFVDIGSHVKQGDVLAIIAAPDLDQQLNQARAQLAQDEAAVQQARANANLALATNQRTNTLVKQGWQTKEQGDIDRLTYQSQAAALQVAQVNVQAQQAVVARLEKLTGFERSSRPSPAPSPAARSMSAAWSQRTPPAAPRSSPSTAPMCFGCGSSCRKTTSSASRTGRRRR